MTEQLGINPWLKVWISPRRTIRRIVDIAPGRGFVWLSAIYGFSMLLQMAQTISLGLYFSAPLIVAAAALFAVFAGMLGITITSALVTWVGHWIGGKASFSHVRAAVAWSNVPNIVTGITWIILTILFREMLFIDGFMDAPFAGGNLWLITTMGSIQFVIAVWSFVILLKTLAEVQGFSAWRALLNVILPFVLVVVALWALTWLIWWIESFIVTMGN